MIQVPEDVQKRLLKRKIDTLTERYYEASLDFTVYDAVCDKERADIEAKKMEDYKLAIEALQRK